MVGESKGLQAPVELNNRDPHKSTFEKRMVDFKTDSSRNMCSTVFHVAAVQFEFALVNSCAAVILVIQIFQALSERNRRLYRPELCEHQDTRVYKLTRRTCLVACPFPSYACPVAFCLPLILPLAGHIA